MDQNVKNYTQKNISEFLKLLSLEGENFYDTPRRVAGVWDVFLTGEFSKKPVMKFFSTKSKEAVIMKNHITWGFCPHHLLPVRYIINLGYIPNGKAVGLSKLPRLADYLISKLPLQEDLTIELAQLLHSETNSTGVACAIKGYHLCYAIRGAKSGDASFITSHFINKMDSTLYREEFLNFNNGGYL